MHTKGEVADALKIHRRTLQRWLKADFPHLVRRGRSLLSPAEFHTIVEHYRSRNRARKTDVDQR